jgi:hypothetical protein
MSFAKKHTHLASVLTRIFALDEATPESVAKDLGYRDAFFVKAWCAGAQLPALTTVVDLANHIGWPLDELVMSWLADSAPEHAIRFKIILAQLLGLPAANDLFSGKLEVDDDIWLTKIGPPMTAAAVCLELDDVPLGSYRDNR